MDEWLQVSHDEGDDVLARFNDGEHDITILTVANPEHQEEYRFPSVVQTSEDSAIVLISDAGIKELLFTQMAFFQNMEEEEKRNAALATAMGMLLLVGVHKLTKESV